jgi:PadR family transcriptional regulator, regulatory protein PadR
MNDEPLTLRHTQILLVLAESQNHGYAIGKALQESSGQGLLPGSLYRALAQLLRRGLIEEASAALAEDPRRREYRLTTAGRAALEGELAKIGDLVAQGRRLGLVPGRG